MSQREEDRDPPKFSVRRSYKKEPRLEPPTPKGVRDYVKEAEEDSISASSTSTPSDAPPKTPPQ